MKLFHIGLCAVGHPENGFQTALRKVFPEYMEINSGHPNLNHEVCRISEEFRPDVVFIQIQTPGIIKPEAVRIMRERGAFVINWTGDARQPVPDWYYEIAKYASLTSFSNMSDVAWMNNNSFRSEFLQIGYDPEIYKPDGVTLSSPEIVFMGNNYNNLFPLGKLRIEMVNELKRKFGSRFGVYGSGWQQADGNFMGNQYGEAEIYRDCKIAINCSHYDLQKYSSDRIFRIMGTGAFCLTKEYPGIEEDFQDGHDLVYWTDIDELIDLCSQYLNERELRKSIAMNGHKLVSSKYTFLDMANNIKKLAS